jgi:hypothetical protein
VPFPRQRHSSVHQVRQLQKNYRIRREEPFQEPGGWRPEVNTRTDRFRRSRIAWAGLAMPKREAEEFTPPHRVFPFFQPVKTALWLKHYSGVSAKNLSGNFVTRCKETPDCANAACNLLCRSRILRK